MSQYRRITGLCILSLALLALPGCLLGAAAVGAGVVAATSEDTARVDIRAPMDAVFDAASRQIESIVKITASDQSRGLLEGKSDGSSIEMSVFRVGEFTRLRVTARKVAGTLPDLDLANRLASDINRSF